MHESWPERPHTPEDPAVRVLSLLHEHDLVPGIELAEDMLPPESPARAVPTLVRSMYDIRHKIQHNTFDTEDGKLGDFPKGYAGDRTTSIDHLVHDKFALLYPPEGTVEFGSEEAATATGYQGTPLRRGIVPTVPAKARHVVFLDPLDGTKNLYNIYAAWDEQRDKLPQHRWHELPFPPSSAAISLGMYAPDGTPLWGAIALPFAPGGPRLYLGMPGDRDPVRVDCDTLAVTPLALPSFTQPSERPIIATSRGLLTKLQNQDRLKQMSGLEVVPTDFMGVGRLLSFFDPTILKDFNIRGKEAQNVGYIDGGYPWDVAGVMAVRHHLLRRQAIRDPSNELVIVNLDGTTREHATGDRGGITAPAHLIERIVAGTGTLVLSP